MKKGSFGKMLMNCFCNSSSSASSCFFCINNSIDAHEDEELATTSLVKSDGAVRIKDVLPSSSGNQTLAFQLKPKVVMLKVSIHCDGCAKKVEKHISKMDGVTSYKIDVESKLVVVVGDIFPIEVLQSVSRVIKYAELWNPSDSISTDDTPFI